MVWKIDKRVGVIVNVGEVKLEKKFKVGVVILGFLICVVLFWNMVSVLCFFCICLEFVVVFVWLF